MTSLKTPLAQQLKTIDVPQFMVEGEKFIKWDEDSVGTPVTLRVDEYGFYLHWIDQNKEMDLLDIATIRDSRTGKQAKLPKDPKLRELVTMGSQDTLEEKTVTLCYGSDFVNLTFINFCCTKKEIAQQWTDELLKLAFSLTQLNGSAMKYLLKAHTKLCLSVDKSNKIPVKNVVKMFAQHRDDRKRVKNALDAAGLPSGKDDALSPSKFTFEDFFSFYKHLTQRNEVEKIFDELCVGGKKKGMGAPQLVEFLNATQRDPRLNEILHPYANLQRAKDIIGEYEPSKGNLKNLVLGTEGFLRYLMSEDNLVVSPSRIDLCDDMDQPLAHYFINSSHNTYLTGHQLTGKSSVEIYRQCLLAGCRCVELDFWNGGKGDEPVIVHGYTFVPEISAKDVIEAIAEAAFKTSEYPVILSFENHCNPRQQAKIAQYCRDIFGDMLLDAPLESYKLEPGVPLPPPSSLKNKIIIKNKKKHHHGRGMERSGTCEVPVVAGNGEIPHPPPYRQGSKEISPERLNQDDNDEEGEESSSGGEEEEGKPAGGPVIREDKAGSARESEAGAEISALVNYVQPVHFVSFEVAEKKNRFYEMSSFDERQATTLLKERPIEFVKYNKQQLSRVYPAGTRFDSSNFMPQVFWNAGCQLVALNYQTLDLAMQLNLGIFEYNKRCGYLLKPEFMRRQDRSCAMCFGLRIIKMSYRKAAFWHTTLLRELHNQFDPFAESTVDGIIAGTVSIHVISGQFLSDKKTGTYIEVDMYGLPADTVRKKFRTRICPNNAINPIYDEEPFVFKKVVLPELACVRISAYEEGGKFIGHRVLPVIGLCPGYRHVGLRTECGQSLPLATLFVHVVVKDYVPDGLSDFAEALANPIKYQSERDKRAQQLSVFADDGVQDDAEEGEKVEDLGAGPGVASLPRTRRTGSVCPAGAGGSSEPPPGPSQHRASIAGMPAGGVPAGAASGGGSGSTAGGEPGGVAHAPLLTQQLPLVPAPAPGGGSSAAPPPSSPPPLQPAPPPILPQVVEELVPESIEKFLESKPVKEKKVELEKKLEALHKKQEKERSRLQSSLDSEKPKTKFYMSNKLVKRLSSKNIDVVPGEGGGGESGAGGGGGETPEGGAGGGDASSRGIPRSTSERILAVHREHVNQERDLVEKYHEMMFASAQKVMLQSQSQQVKMLGVLLERETNDVMRRLQASRRQEVKALAKQHRDRDELVRMKREVATAMVEKGVHERMRLTELYTKKKEELEKQHNEIRAQLNNEKAKAKATLLKELEKRHTKFESEVQGESKPTSEQ